MIIRKLLFLWILPLIAFQSLSTLPLAEQFKQAGYSEICDPNRETALFDSLYVYFDELIEFLQKTPVWTQKLRIAKERFIRSKDQKYYSTDFFGFYDESKREGRSQISFYYSSHFHKFMDSHYPEFKQIPEITHFFETCLKIQQPYGDLFNEAAIELGLDTLFSFEPPPLLFKVVKYLPSYCPTKPHYDGTAFSLLLDSTDHQSLLLSPYRTSLTVDNFSTPLRQFSHSILLIPGTLLSEFSIPPTPHIVMRSGKTRYATIAFAMRPHYPPQKNEYSPLPTFKD
jgi:hypothetical protein